MLLRGLLLVSALAVASTPLRAGERAEILQPANGEQGMILLSEQGRATFERPGGRRKQIRLRSKERLTDFTETRSGWAAAGTRAGSGRKRLIVIQQGAGGLRRLPEPPSQTDPLRLAPRLMVAGNEVKGVAWLEGTHPGGMSVRAAGWDGIEWQPVEVVAPPLGGSQTGLSGTVLADGSWLLVWAAFDGHDDEIYWSRKKSRAWTPPRRLEPDDLWPDVTPKVIAAQDGALAAWSSFDGSDYRLTISRFDGSSWQAPQIVGGKGSIDPQLTALDRNLYLLFRTSASDSWSVLQLQTTGRVLRQTSVAGPVDERPVVTWTSRYQVGLRSASVRQTTAQWGRPR